MSRTRTLKKSFGYAIEGLKTAIKNEPNFQNHLIVGSATLVAALLLGFNRYEWLILLFTIAFVLILELFNTSLEAIVNLVSPDIRPYAKTAKDVSAAAVLLAAIIAVVVGIVLFIPKIITL